MARRSSSIRPPSISAATAPRSAARSSMAAISTGRSMPNVFPGLNQPDPSYHGAVWTQAVKPLGPIAYIIKARVTLLRDLGASMSPFNAFQFIQGLETLPLRMREHCRNAQAVAEFLNGHPSVTKVIHPGFQDGEDKRRAQAYLKGGPRRSGRLRDQGRCGSRTQIHRRAGAVLSRGQYRRCAEPRNPPGEHHAFAALAGRAAEDRRQRFLCAALGRVGAYRRHPRRSAAALDQATGAKKAAE